MPLAAEGSGRLGTELRDRQELVRSRGGDASQVGYWSWQAGCKDRQRFLEQRIRTGPGGSAEGCSQYGKRILYLAARARRQR